MGSEQRRMGFSDVGFASPWRDETFLEDGREYIDPRAVRELLRRYEHQQTTTADQVLWDRARLADPRRRDRFLNYIPLAEPLEEATHAGGICLYCGSSMSSEESSALPLEGPWDGYYHGFHCGGCGWWVVRHEECWDDSIETYWLDYIPPRVRFAYAVLQEYDPFALDTPLALAREYLVRHPHHLARFDGKRFEVLLYECLRECGQYAELIKCGGSKDGGIDLLAVRLDGETIVIQLKCRQDLSRPEGVDVVRSLHGVMLRDGFAHGMVITTAPRFTRGAEQEAAKTARRLAAYSMEFKTFDDVVEILQIPQGMTTSWTDFGITFTAPTPAWHAPLTWTDSATLSAILEPGSSAAVGPQLVLPI